MTRFSLSSTDTDREGKPLGPSTDASFAATNAGKYSRRRRSASMRNATKLVSVSRAAEAQRS